MGAFEFLERNPSITESDYPYTGKDQECNEEGKKGVARVTSYVEG